MVWACFKIEREGLGEKMHGLQSGRCMVYELEVDEKNLE